MQKWQRRNARPNSSIPLECMHGASNKMIAQKYGISPGTVGRQLHRNHEKLPGGQIHYPCPIVMGIDGHSIHRRSTKGHKFAVTLTDPRNNRVCEVFDDKASKTLEPQPGRLKGRKRSGWVPLAAKPRKKVWQLLHEAPEVFKKLGRTIRLWFEQIIRMWRFTKNNGITEGFHLKMKLIQRRAYGYRNFKNYRLRVLMECGHVQV